MARRLAGALMTLRLRDGSGHCLLRERRGWHRPRQRGEPADARPMPIPRFRPPQQTRSQETLDRILDAAERVLEEKSFTEATLAEIMERAGVTVGAFYRRFPDKDALLHLLDERFFRQMQERADELLDPDHWRGASVSDIVGEFARTAVEVYGAK